MGSSVRLKLNTKLTKEKTIDTLTTEIISYKRNITSSIIEIGKRLKQVKEDDLTHGKWSDWLRTIEIEPRQAQRFIQAYEQFGDTSASTHLESSKIIEMLTLPPEVDRSKFIAARHTVPSTGEEKTVTNMSTREIREVVREVRRAAGLVKERPSTRVKVEGTPNNASDNFDDEYSVTDELEIFIKAAKKLHPDIKWAVFNSRVTIDQAISISTLPEQQQKEFGAVLMRQFKDFNDKFFDIFKAISKGYKQETVGHAMRVLEKIDLNFIFIASIFSATGMKSDIGKIMKDDEVSEQEFLTRIMEHERKIDEAKARWESHEDDFTKRTQEEFEEHFGKVIQKPKKDSPYKVLGLEEDASFDEVKASYRKLMQLVHPDKGGTSYLFLAVKTAYDEIYERERLRQKQSA
ncbi:DnaJ domain-containing protein [Brevibacillus laterosporus]|uniref:DnaJ domain-containing protein n=1 Tax=Brevibacillus laterosporus TaxID=1465 RepID=UPI000839B567|nr:DnaJ domain-containing protein [Brevibacillus laterosporus]